MEDTHFLMPQLCNDKNSNLFGIFDGHRGAAAAEFCARALLSLLHSLCSTKSPSNALSKAFVKTDVAFRNELVVQLKSKKITQKDWHPGCTASAALQVTRPIGDDDLKPAVTAEPEITETILTFEDEYLVMASDGLWDVVSNEKVICIIRNTVKEPGMCSKRLATEAAERGSKDNIMVIVVYASWYTSIFSGLRSGAFHGNFSSSWHLHQVKEREPKFASTISVSEQEQGPRMDQSAKAVELPNKDVEPKPNSVHQSMDVSSSKLSSSSTDAPPKNDRIFVCHYCPRKFSSSQALGGHQNAHKHERTLAKRGQGMDTMSYGSYPTNHLYPYTGLGTFPTLHGSLGIRMQPAATRKPYYSWPLAGLRYCHGSWARPGANLQPAATIGRLHNGGIQMSDNAARFNGAGGSHSQAVAPKIAAADASGGTHHWSGSPLETQSQELDLTLKL